MKHLFSIIPIIIATILGVHSNRVLAAEAPFSVSAKSTFSLNWRGRQIIAADDLDKTANDPLTQPEGYRREELNGEIVENTWKVKDVRQQITYRREVASRDDRVEVTTQFRIPAYYFDDKPKDLQVFYRFRIPLEVLAGMKFQAVVRQAGRVKTVSGVITPGTAPDIAGQTIYITFTDAQGHHLSFDFGPSGVTSFDRNTSATSLPESWWSGADKDEIRFSVGRLQASTYPYNGVYNGKVIIDESTFEEFRERHAHHTYSYYMELPAIYQFSFGAGQLGDQWRETSVEPLPELTVLARKKDRWIPAGKQQIAASNNFGWKEASHINLQGDVAKGVLHGVAKSTFPGHFQVKLPQPGIYIFTIRSAAQQQPVGPFDISANNQIAASDITVAPDEIKTITFSRYVKEGIADIQLSGNWAVSSIAVQYLIHQSEDFTFDRGLWLAEDIPTPTTLFQWPREPIIPAASVQEYPAKVLLNTSHQHADNAPAAALKSIDFKTDNPATAWRWTSNITALGPGNKGSFYEFETEDEINRRLDQLQELGYTTILLNGMLIRHAYPEEAPHVQEVVARIVRLAHARDMKVLDHFDVTVLPNLDGALKLMLDHIDWTLRDVRNGQPTRGFCINNPHFQKYFYDRMSDYVRTTQLDGIMLDEITFHKALYCGCEYCREAFHHDTGLTLPVNENDADLLNDESRLWREWQLWRTKAQGDFCVQLMQRMRQINPNFVWMKYGAPSVFTKPRMVDGGARLSEASRFSNFLGIESLTNNVYANFRSKFAVAQIFNSMTATENIPGFDLIYHNHQPVFAYAGWALNNMTGHRTWSTQGNEAIEKDAKRYLNWKDNMDARRVELVADVAVLHSESTRDFSGQGVTYREYVKGMSQALGDMHVPYQVLLNRDLTLANLQKYRLVILPNSSAMSDAELAAVRQFLEAGGHVLATAQTAMQDELGFKRQVWPLGKWLGIETTEKADAKAERQIGKGKLVWYAAPLGRPFFETYARAGVKWTYEPNAALLQQLEAVIAAGRGANAPFQAVQIPTPVLLTVYRERDGNETFIHLYNGSGVTLRKGDKIPSDAPKDAFPKLAGDIIFDIELPSKSTFTADFVSPDYTGSRKVTLQPLGNSRYRVTVAAADLHAYGMVRIR